MTKSTIEALFPNLKNTTFNITSPEKVDYNCIAWAAGESDTWWWPDQLDTCYWPENTERTETLEAFTKAFESLSYLICDSVEHEEAFEKIALYANEHNKPTHAARQLESGLWTSKLGQSFDIEHELNGVSGHKYGRIVTIMKRPIIQSE